MRTYSFATDWRVSVLGENAFKTVELPRVQQRQDTISFTAESEYGTAKIDMKVE